MAEEQVFPGPLSGIKDATPPDPNFPSSDRRNFPQWFNGTHLAELAQRIIHPYPSEAAMRGSLSPTAGTRLWAFTEDTATLWTSVGNQFVRVWANGGGAWTSFTPTLRNWNPSTGDITDLTPGGFSYSGSYTLIGPKTASWRVVVDFGNPGGLGENVILISLPGPLQFRNPQMGSAKVVHDGSTYGAICQTNGNSGGRGNIAILRTDGTGGGFYHRRIWGTGTANDWKNGDAIVASGTWELS